MCVPGDLFDAKVTVRRVHQAPRPGEEQNELFPQVKKLDLAALGRELAEEGSADAEMKTGLGRPWRKRRLTQGCPRSSLRGSCAVLGTQIAVPLVLHSP